MSFERFDREVEEGNQFAKLVSSSIKGCTMTVEVSCPRKKFEWQGFIIQYNHKIEEDREAYFVAPADVKTDARDVRMTMSLDLSEFPFRYTHWSILCLYKSKGQCYTAHVVKKKEKTDVRKFVFEPNNYTTKDGNIVFFYTQRGRYLGIRYRAKNPYDGQDTRIKEGLARLEYRRNRVKLIEQGIILIYEKRCQHAQDNGYHLFCYCMENNMEEYLGRKIYYVIDKDSIDRPKLEKYKDNVVDFMSVKHMVYLLAARLMLSPDSQAHAYIWQPQDSIIAPKVRKIPHVFLGHGVLAMKRLNDSFTAKNMKSVLCTVVSEKERRIFTDELGFKGMQVAITGYARFDALHDMSEGRREILVMPTHRSWLFGVERRIFVESEYYKRYMDLLNSPHLLEQLEKHDVTLLFYLHPSIGEHVDAFSSTSERVKIVPYGETSLDDLMMRCKLLVTDYSSVAWDVLYMGKPIVFYQYDLQSHLDTWGSYIDLKTESPGMRVEDLEGLLGAIDTYIDIDFKLDPELEAKRDEYYAYLDHDNSKRICEELKKRRL